MPADRFLLDFLPFERRALRRTGIALFKVDYSSIDLLPLWRRDNQQPVERVVVYDPRSLARVWLLDDTTDDYIAVPYRIPHPDMTLAESEEARRRMRASRAQDRTERRLFENLAEIRAIEEQARSATSRRKAERTRLADKAARESRDRTSLARAARSQTVGGTTGPGHVRPTGRPATAMSRWTRRRPHGPGKRSRRSAMSSGSDMTDTSTPHLSDAARCALDRSDAHRIARSIATCGSVTAAPAMPMRGWSGYCDPNADMRPDNLLIVGASNNGKTAIARRFLARHTAAENPDAERSHIETT